jgi:glutamyl-tRNA reductase
MIGVVGLNHERAAVEIRERFVFDEQEIEKFVVGLKKHEPFDEVVILSTCNRTEVYFSSPKPCGQRDLGALIRFLCAFKNIHEDICGLFYTFQEQEAVGHLFGVASGLNSMVLGENQILGQVKTAYRISASRKLTGAVLNRLFHKAFEVGKTVRSQTALNEGASSVGYAAVELAARIFTNLPEHPVLLVGAGQTGELVLESLAKRGNRHLHIANRTRRRAEELAERFGAEVVAFDGLMDHLLHCDIIIVSTASREPLFRLDDLREVMKKRHNRGLFLIDLSVPRGVESAVRELEEVFVYDVDDLDMVVAHNREKRKGEIEKADRIVDRHTAEFFAWLGTLDLAPAIARLKDCFDSIPAAELEKLKNRLPSETYDRVQEFSDFIKGKYLGMIVKNLKTLSREGRQLDYIDMVNNLFDLTSGKKE